MLLETQRGMVYWLEPPYAPRDYYKEKGGRWTPRQVLRVTRPEGLRRTR